jgi:type II secretory pathway pseudopilin PulG
MSAILSRPRSGAHNRKSGFTGIDLLVVLAVVSVLGALVMISLTMSQRKVGLAQCTDNLRQVNHAVLQFTEDNNKTLPTPVAGLPGELWWWYKELVKKYAGLTGASSANDRVFACPGDRGYTDAKPFHDNPRFDYTSYVFNGVSLPGVPSVAGWPVASVKQTQKTLLTMEWTAHAPLSWHNSKTGKKNLPFYNDAASVLGFVDGHVSYANIYYDGYNAAFTRDPIAGYEYKFSGN